MADIKRPNYFTSQFLVERDFNDEQAYHVNMRRRHNRLLHAFGVADGLLVTRAGPTSVQVSAGTAVDRDGREIVLQDPRTFPLQTSGNNLDVFLWIAYGEFLDPADKDTQSGLDKFLRTTEKPLLQDGRRGSAQRWRGDPARAHSPECLGQHRVGWLDQLDRAHALDREGRATRDRHGSDCRRRGNAGEVRE
jgi:hypothetical protein